MSRLVDWPVQILADVLVALLWSADRKRARGRTT